MYLLLGDTVVSDKTIIGVFDLDATTVSLRTRDFLRQAQDAGEVVSTSFELPKAFVVCAPRTASRRRADRRQTVCITQYLPQTVTKRI